MAPIPRNAAVVDATGHTGVTVVHLVEDFNIGGMERVVATVAGGLSPQRFDCRVWCLVRGGELAGECNRPLRILNYRTYHNPVTLLRLAAQLRRARCRIVHAHGYFAATAGRLAAWLAQTPVIISHVHTTYGHLRPRHRFIEKQLSRVTDLTICCSEAVRSFMADVVKVDRRKLLTVYNGSTMEACRSAPAGERHRSRSGVTLAVVASLVPNKGHRWLLEAFAPLCRRHAGLELIVAGDGPLRPELQRFAAALGIGDRVRFLGICRDVTAIYEQADICILPSVAREGLGLCLIEAMACGRAVVGSRVGGIPEVITDGVNGYLVEPGNVDRLQERLDRLIADARLRETMGLAGRKRFEQQFTGTKMVGRIAEAYQRLLLNRRRQRPINILYLHNKSDLQGGGEQSLIQLWRHLDRRAFRPHLAVPGEGALADAARLGGLTVSHLPVPKIAAANIGRLMNVFRQLLRYCRHNRIDIIHSYTPRNNLLAAGVGAILGLGVLWHERNLIHGKEVDLSRRWRWLPDAILCNSNAVAARFETNHRRPCKVKAIHNGVDLRQFAPGHPSGETLHRFRLEGKPVVGLISGLSRRKMPEYFIEAGRLVIDRCPRAVLMIVGAESGPGAIDRRTALENLAERLGILPNCRFTGFVSDVAGIIRTLDIGAAVTENEACSRAIIEMQASAKPVVAFDTGGNAELIVDGVTGRLVEFGNVGALSDAIVDLLADDTARTRMGANARSRMQRHFDIRRQVRLTEALYRQLAEDTGCRRRQ